MDRTVTPEADIEERAAENPLRPSRLSDYKGQPRVQSVLGTAIEAARARQEPLGHQMFYGPPGLGKTTLSYIIAKEMGTEVKITSGPVMRTPSDLFGVIATLREGDVFFIDEIHRLPMTTEETLYSVMEDFAIDVMVGKGENKRSIRMPVPRITVVGATTRLGSVTEPLRDRFGIIHRLEYYDAQTLHQIVQRSGGVLGVEVADMAAIEIALRCRRTPRIANRLLMRCRDYAQINGSDAYEDGTLVIDHDIAKRTLETLGIDEYGLDEMDRELMRAMLRDYNGGPVGLKTMAALVGEPVNTVEDAMEPYLMRMGLLARTPRGRELTEAGRAHIG
jgi:Holliday junction DNA helicase RuvB